MELEIMMLILLGVVILLMLILVVEQGVMIGLLKKRKVPAAAPKVATDSGAVAPMGAAAGSSPDPYSGMAVGRRGVQVICRNCYQAIPADSRVCPRCGTPVNGG